MERLKKNAYFEKDHNKGRMQRVRRIQQLIPIVTGGGQCPPPA
jgi:hypothetical protein